MPVHNRCVELPALHLSCVEARETREVQVVEHLLKPQEALRSGIEAGAHSQHPHVAPLNETERGPEIPGNVAPYELRIELVVWVLRRDAIGPISAGNTFVHAPQG